MMVEQVATQCLSRAILVGGGIKRVYATDD